uniref:Uncharacterized protein n=1 Tax=Noctiluca scintillans TaxID=2966 RepID=A0A7S1AZ97_NOCSC
MAGTLILKEKDQEVFFKISPNVDLLISEDGGVFELEANGKYMWNKAEWKRQAMGESGANTNRAVGHLTQSVVTAHHEPQVLHVVMTENDLYVPGTQLEGRKTLWRQKRAELLQSSFDGEWMMTTSPFRTGWFDARPETECDKFKNKIVISGGQPKRSSADEFDMLLDVRVWSSTLITVRIGLPGTDPTDFHGELTTINGKKHIVFTNGSMWQEWSQDAASGFAKKFVSNLQSKVFERLDTTMSSVTAMMQNARGGLIGRTMDSIMPKGATRTVEAEKKHRSEPVEIEEDERSRERGAAQGSSRGPMRRILNAVTGSGQPDVSYTLLR